MQIKLIYLLLLLFTSAHALVLNVKSMQNYMELEGMFKLSDPEKDRFHAILDCQSYFQKLEFKSAENEMYQEYYITQSECHALYESIKNCLTVKKNKCMDSNDIFNTSCYCE